MSMAAQNKITRSRAVRPSAMLSGVGDFGLAIELSDRFDSLGSGRRSMQPGADPRHHEQRSPNTRPPTDASGWRTKPRLYRRRSAYWKSRASSRADGS